MKGIFFISQDARSNQSNITSPTLAYEEDTKIEYFHQNPVKRGYVDEAEHWLYSSARDYAGQDGLFEVSRQW